MDEVCYIEIGTFCLRDSYQIVEKSKFCYEYIEYLRLLVDILLLVVIFMGCNLVSQVISMYIVLNGFEIFRSCFVVLGWNVGEKFSKVFLFILLLYFYREVLLKVEGCFLFYLFNYRFIRVLFFRGYCYCWRIFGEGGIGLVCVW